ncbi:MAG TPA: segregation/condensation protein A [Planctomycetota bacterium]|nr:segregation/condensation protein A [Planctomycetota bacterium]
MSEAPAAGNLPSPTVAQNGVRTAVGSRVDFSAKLETFQGPLDLLLYLIKENEVEITEIPIASILSQYLHFIDSAEQWDLQVAGEFLVMATTLMEIKSRELLPVQIQQQDGEEIIEDPRSELVRQLLQYRKLKEQAKALESLQDAWEEYRPRGLFGDVPEPGNEENVESDRATAREALIDVDIYGLFAAYERVLKSVLATAPRNIVFSGETLEDKVIRIEKLLKERPFARFVDLIREPGSREDIAATFYALLELIRRRSVRLLQQQELGNFDIKAQQEGEMDAQSREEAAAAEAAADAVVKAKAEQDAALAAGLAEGAEKLPWNKRRAPARPKFEGIVRPEDVEEIDAEENEIGRRIDAILAAADAISERFEQSREGRVRLDENGMPIIEGAPASEGEQASAEEDVQAQGEKTAPETQDSSENTAAAEGEEPEAESKDENAAEGSDKQ